MATDKKIPEVINNIFGNFEEFKNKVKEGVESVKKYNGPEIRSAAFVRMIVGDYYNDSLSSDDMRDLKKWTGIALTEIKRESDKEKTGEILEKGGASDEAEKSEMRERKRLVGTRRGEPSDKELKKLNEINLEDTHGMIGGFNKKK